MRSELRAARVHRMRRNLAAYLAGPAAFDLAMASVLAIVALGYREAIAIGLWLALVVAAFAERYSTACKPLPRAWLVPSPTRRSTRGLKPWSSATPSCESRV